MRLLLCEMVDWSIGRLVIGGLVDWWIGGLVRMGEGHICQAHTDRGWRKALPSATIDGCARTFN